MRIRFSAAQEVEMLALRVHDAMQRGQPGVVAKQALGLAGR